MTAMLVALLLDLAVGWPDRLYRRVGHPVTWIGAQIARLDRDWNHGRPEARRRAGARVAAVVVGAAAGVALLATWLLPGGLPGEILAGVLAWPLVAARSLHWHVDAVRAPLARGDVRRARAAVSHVVGRDPDALDEAGIARAATESLAENASDGVVAPIVWGVLLGLPGIAAYKALNTLDSMIGHRTDAHEEFGRVSAIADDLANWLPARLTGAALALVSENRRAAFAVMRRDAHHHRSPNAGWPEAAMAGALDVRLSGPRRYGARLEAEPWLNEGAPDPDARDLGRALGLYERLLWALGAVLAAGALL